MNTHGIMIGQIARGPVAAPRGAAVGASQIDRHIAANFYPTPPEATLALLSVESFDGSVWEPACGKGHIASVLKSQSFRSVLTTLRSWDFSTEAICPLPQAGSQMEPSKLSTESSASVASGGVG